MIMDYKEKYNRLLDAIKELQKANPSDDGIQNWINDNVHELKESEDEQHRKWILEYLYDGLRKSDEQFKDQFKSAIAWLEKQGEKSQDASYSKFDFNDVLALQCCLETVKKVQEDTELYEKLNQLHSKVYDAYRLEKQGESDETKAKRYLINKGYPVDANGIFPTYEETYNIIKDGIEKQGERKDAAKYGYKFAVEKACEWIRQQKEMLEDSFSDVNDFADLLKEAMEEKQGSPVLSNSSNIGKGEQKPTDSYCRENCKGYQETGKCFADGDCKAKREAVESIDKVEPKFHEGDWITNGDYTWKIVEVMPLDYTLQSQDGNTIVDDNISYVDEQFHSFTVKDARDGDVLITVDDERPFIFKGCLDPNHPDSPVAYCGIDTEGYFCVGESKFNYWWTDEKVHPATKEQRNLLFQKMKEAGYEWDAEKKELKKIEQKTVWSEEDEKNWQGVIDEIKANKSNAPDCDVKTYDRFLSWLESLKQRLA